MKIAISSGKGGTGKTLIATNLALAYAGEGNQVTYLDCDVEEPNGHIFMRPDITEREDFPVRMPERIDTEACTACGSCVEACQYNALALINDTVLFFPELCHACGACSLVCPQDAVVEADRTVGVIHHGAARGSLGYHYAELHTGEGGMSPRLIKALKRRAGKGITILDSPPGTACPVVETVIDADYCVLVTDPTPFGIHDLTLSVNMCRAVGQEPGILVNRSGLDQTGLDEYLRREDLTVVGDIPDDQDIARVYSRGGLIVDEMPGYRERFHTIAAAIMAEAEKHRKPTRTGEPERPTAAGAPEKAVGDGGTGGIAAKNLVILSGKGGTGKTSIAGCFAACADRAVISDCDVDASDLHLLLNPAIQVSGDFSGGVMCLIDQDKCVRCGDCFAHCRFEAIRKQGDTYTINEMACEGCGSCRIVCKEDAVHCTDAVNGTWYVSDTRFGPMSHAKLGFAEENSGRLVTLVRNKATGLCGRDGRNLIVIDGSPGTGCPVIASMTGSDYALMVTEPTLSGIHDLERILDVARHFGVAAGVVVNKADINPEITETIRLKCTERDADYFGEIPYDAAVTEAQIQALTLMEYAPQGDTARRIRELWEKVLARVTS